MVYIFFSFLQILKMMYVGNYALCCVCANQFGSSLLCSYAMWASVYSAIYEEHAIPIQICTMGGYLHIWIHSYSQGMPSWLYNLYYDATLSFQGNEFWSFHGLLQDDHQQIHTKWVTDYNIECIEHLAFVINGEKIWVHWGVLCPNINVMLPMTQVAFAIMV